MSRSNRERPNRSKSHQMSAPPWRYAGNAAEPGSRPAPACPTLVRTTQIAMRRTRMNWKSKRGGGEAAVETDLRSPIGPVGSDTVFANEVQRAAGEGRFHLDFQPLFSVRDETPVGVEALLRLDTDSGRVTPGRFVPILEASGLIGSVGEWVLT